MKHLTASILAVLTVFSAQAALAERMEPLPEPQLEIVASMDQRPGNIAVNIDGRVFVTMHPFDNPRCKLMEVFADGSSVPYPNEDVSCGAGAVVATESKDTPIASAIAIHASIGQSIMVLDMGNKTQRPRLIVINTLYNKVDNVIEIPEKVTTDQSFLQDFAYNWYTGTIFIADMGQADLTGTPKPAILTMLGGNAPQFHRYLDGHPSVMPPEQVMQAGGRSLSVLKDGATIPIRAGLNPITIDPQNGWIYFAPMAAGKIYRMPIDAKPGVETTSETVAKSVEAYADKPASDGMTIDAAGNIYLTSVDSGEIGLIDPVTRQYRTYLKDPRIVWPDGFSFGPDGMLYVTINQLHLAPQLNGGKEEGVKPYLVARFRPVTMGALGR